MCATGSASALCNTASMTSPPHRKRVRHFEGNGHLHELTFSCYRRKPLLTNDTWRRIPASQLDRACEAEGFGLVAFVFIPEHVSYQRDVRRRFANHDSSQSELVRRLRRPTRTCLTETEKHWQSQWHTKPSTVPSRPCQPYSRPGEGRLGILFTGNTKGVRPL